MKQQEDDPYQKVVSLAEEKGCEFVDLKFVDLPGSWQHITLSISGLPKDLFKNGIGFDGSSIRGFKKINDSDMLMVPDPSTAFFDPVPECPVMSLICNIVDPETRKQYLRDPRSVARKAEEFLKDSDIADVSYWGPELEFFIFNSISFDSSNFESYYHVEATEGIWNSGRKADKNTGYYVRPTEGYLSVPPGDQMHNLRTKIVKAITQTGQRVVFHHHEVASGGQSEIGMSYGTLVSQADNTLVNKYITKNIAVQNGFTATFMPKPLFLDNGNAFHVHQSLWKNGKNLFYDPLGYALLSKTALYYIGGLLEHTPALLAFCAPSTNSYRRLVPGYEAPVNLVYSQRNRSAAIRIPISSQHSGSKRIEYRCPDATGNPYLAFAAMLMAGLDGIVHKIDPGDPVDKDLFEMSQLEKKDIKSVPDSMDKVLDALEKDHQFLLEGGVFSSDLIETWIEYKRRNELDEMALRPHPYEFNLYYDV
ncbi:MAG: type I glutamate--ammonia ligase [Dehalococcoidales bacterium]|nr:type I glutamate--ammonia ligase [Dehalococcoidales bacterium]